MLVDVAAAQGIPNPADSERHDQAYSRHADAIQIAAIFGGIGARHGFLAIEGRLYCFVLALSFMLLPPYLVGKQPN
jgi:hypothetical protein